MGTENPASPYFSASGAKEGSASDLLRSTQQWTPVHYIDAWLAAPFHAAAILQPTLGAVGFATFGEYAGLDVVSGIGQHLKTSLPTLFPGAGMVTDLTKDQRGEVPNPVSACGWSATGTYGLPLVVLEPSAITGAVSATLTEPSGVVLSSAGGDLCVVDSTNWPTTDPVYGILGAQILANDNAIFLVPREPLANGSYRAHVTATGAASPTWSFTVAPTGPASPSASVASRTRTAQVSLVSSALVENRAGSKVPVTLICRYWACGGRVRLVQSVMRRRVTITHQGSTTITTAISVPGSVVVAGASFSLRRGQRAKVQLVVSAAGRASLRNARVTALVATLNARLTTGAVLEAPVAIR